MAAQLAASQEVLSSVSKYYFCDGNKELIFLCSIHHSTPVSFVIIPYGHFVIIAQLNK
jgi:hypothetical protein